MDIASLPLVSVYLPTRGRPQLLERAVRSVLAQTWKKIELIVVVDGPCPATENILEAIGAEDLGEMRLLVRILPEPRGACIARNEALQLASGVYVTGLDDDDYFLPERIEELVSTFDATTSSFLATGYLRVHGIGIRDTGRELVYPRWQTIHLRQLMRSNVVGNQIFTTLDRMRGVGGFDETLPAWQDYDCWLRLLQAYGPASTTNDCSYVQDLCSGHEQRISADMTRVDYAIELFEHKHRAVGDWAFPSFVRMNRAFYGGDVLSLSDLVVILVVDPHWFVPALRHYLGGKFRKTGSARRC